MASMYPVAGGSHAVADVWQRAAHSGLLVSAVYLAVAATVGFLAFRRRDVAGA